MQDKGIPCILVYQKHMKKNTELLSPRQGLPQLMARRIEHFHQKGKYKTANNCRCTLKHFITFQQGKQVTLDRLSPGLMKDFQDYLIRKGLKMNTVSLYLRMLRAAYNYAVDEEIIHEDKRPFRKVFTGQEKTRKRALSQKVVKQLMETPVNNSSLEFTRNLFLFSIYMQGMPFVDMAHLKKSQIQKGYIIYQRRKTNRTLRVKIDPHAQKIIDQYGSKDPSSPYLFPILPPRYEHNPVVYASALRLYNKRLKQLSHLMKLNEPLTSYVSRHTWASLARSCGISDTIICEAMGHNHIETTTIYLAALDTNIIDKANKKLIASLMRWRI